MNFDNLKPYRITRFGGQCDWDDPSQIPAGLAIAAQNCRFSPEGVGTRFGTKTTMLGTDLSSGEPVGFDVLNTLGKTPKQIALVYGEAGKLYLESPPGSGTLVPVVVPVLLQSGLVMQDALANNQMYMAFSDLNSSTIPPIYYDGRTNNIDTIGQNPLGALWKPGSYYKAGDTFRSVDGRWWRNTNGSPGAATTNVPPVPQENGFFSTATATGFIVNISWSNGVTTALIQPLAGDLSFFRVGDHILVSGVASGFYNGNFVIAAITGNTVQWNQAPPAPSVVGAITTISWVRDGSTTSGTTTAFLPNGTDAYTVGDNVSISQVPDSFFDGNFIITAIGPNTLEWQQGEPVAAGIQSIPIASIEVIAATGSPLNGVSLGGGGAYVDQGPSAIVVSGGGGSGAQVGFSLQLTNQPGPSDPHARLSVNQVFLGNPGSGYTSAPTLTFVGGIGSPASAQASIGPPLVPVGFVRVTLEGQNPFALGTVVTFAGLTNATFLNGNSVTITNLPSGNQFDAQFSHPNYGPTIDSGTVTGFVAASTGDSAGGLASLADNSVDPSSGGMVSGTSESLVWNPATAMDDNGGIWEEWTPNCANQLLAPVNLTGIHQPGNGTIAAGLDVYIRTTFVIPQTGETPPSLALIIAGTQSNDQIVLRQPRMPRWMAEINLQPQRFNEFFLNVYVAAVAAGATAPLDADYIQSAILLPVGKSDVTVNVIPNSNITTFPQGAFLSLKTPDAPSVFIGEGGRRHMIVDRKDRNDSLYPVDSDSAIPVDIQGQISANIVPPTAVSRISHVVTYWLDDISQFFVGQTVTAIGLLDTSFNGTFVITALGPGAPTYPSPGGFIQRAQVAIDATTSGGTIRSIAPPPPVAFLPPGGTSDSLDILALTVVGAGRAGPFAYIPEADPQKIVRTTITSIRSDGTTAFVTVSNGAGLEAGQSALVAGFTGNNAYLNGIVQIGSISGTSVSYLQPGSAANLASPGNISLTVLNVLPTTAPATPESITKITRDTSGNVVASVSDVGGYEPGHIIQASAVQDGSFNGIFQVVSVSVNDDGFSGDIGWSQLGQLASASSGGTISSVPDFVLNFKDSDIEGALSTDANVTNQLTSIQPPPCIDIFYSESTRKFIYTRGDDSSHYFSNTDDPANIASPDGILGINSSNGKRTIAFREMLNGELISLKEDGGYSVEPNDGTPLNWNVNRRWSKHAPAGPRAISLGPDYMLIFAPKTGPYRYYQGALAWIGKELTGTWGRVNWAAQKEIWIEIDEDQKKAYFGLPLDGATTCSHRATLDFFNGWEDPLVQSYTGEMIPNRLSRRWSVDPYPTRYGKMVERNLAVPVDERINDKQMLFGIPDVDFMTLRMEVPDTYNDDGQGYDSPYEPAYAQTGKLEVCGWEGLSGRANGNGDLVFTAVALEASIQKASRRLTLPTDSAGVSISTPFQGGEKVETDLFTYKLSNGGVADAWYQIQEMILWYTPRFSARRNENLIQERS